MILRKWLITNQRGTARLTERKPQIGANEVAVYLEVEIPNGLFEKPRLVAKMKIPESIVTSKEVNAEVTDNIEEAIRTATGLDMEVRIAEPPKEES